MKAKELMLGDFVINTEFGKNEIDQVDTIESTRVWLKGEKLYTPIAYIEPIPLTAEILKKNGFKVVNRVGRVEYTMEDDFHCIEIYEYNNMTYWMHSESKEFNLPTARVININYVHELQHALHMCAVEKEIVL